MFDSSSSSSNRNSSANWKVNPTIIPKLNSKLTGIIPPIEVENDDNSTGLGSTSSLSVEQCAVYFGGDARGLFNERYQMLSRQRKIVAKTSKETVVSTYFSGANRLNDDTIALKSLPTKPQKYGLLRPLRKRSTTSEIAFDSIAEIALDSLDCDDNIESRGRYADGNPINQGSSSGSGLLESSNSRMSKCIEETLDLDSGLYPNINDCDDNNLENENDNYDNDDDSSTDSFLGELADNDYNPSSIAQPLSPRSRFISSCIREGLNPRASLVLRKRMSTHLKLSHLSIGDKVAIILAESLVDLPDVESIDISDNVLTDLSLEPLLKAVSTISSLKELNLSSNVIGPKAAKAISNYLSSPNCPLQRLILQNADVDDYECERFIAAISDNDTLIEIDLSGNKIGSAEALNTVKPDLVTGAVTTSI